MLLKFSRRKHIGIISRELGIWTARKLRPDLLRGHYIYAEGDRDDEHFSEAIEGLPDNPGGKLVASEGTYNFAAGVTVNNKDNVHIQGAGLEATKIVPADTVHAFTFSNTFFGSLSDLSISAASQQTTGIGVRWMEDSYQMALRRVRCNNLYDSVVVDCYTSGPSNPRAETGWIEDCTFWDTKHHVFTLTRFIGLFISGCNAWNATDCTRGIYWVEGGGLWLTDCDFMKCGSALVVAPGSGQATKWLFATNLSLDTLAGYGVQISGDGVVAHFQFVNLHVSSATQNGVGIYSLANAQDFSFINPRVFGCGLSGWYLSTFKDLLIQGGMVFDNNMDDGGTAPVQQGIYLINVDNARIVGLRALNGIVSPAGHQKYGVYHAGGGSDVLVHDCDLGDNETDGFYSADWTKVQVRNNAGFVTENSGTATLLSGQTTLVVAHGLATTPTLINIAFREQGTADYGRWWVDTIGATNFTLNVSVDPGANNLDFAWEAKVR